MFRFLFAFGLCWICSGQSINPTSKPIWNATYTDLLKKDLLIGYDKFARPAQHYNMTVVSVKLTIRHVELDEDKSVFSAYGWLASQWKDEKLKWKESDYGGLTSVHMADHELWQPDLLLYNGATGTLTDMYGNSHCIVQSSGDILWVPPTHYQSFCQLDLRLWPFDTQECTILMGSWTHHGEQIDLQINDKGVELDLSTENNQWEVTKASATRHQKYYIPNPEPYLDVTFNFTLVRRSPMYKTVVITPAVGVILMTLANFWLPAQSGEKILLNGVNALIIVTFLTYFAQRLPSMAIHTPLVVLFYSSALYMVSFSMIISVIVINLSKTKQAQAIPWYLKRVLDGYFGTVLGLKRISGLAPKQPIAEELRDQPFDEHVTSDDHHIIQSCSKGPIQQDYIILATAIDRVAFLIYCFVFIVLAITYSV
ncbi:acetylcholine receptor subunit alpha-like 2 [Bradysia coprophila]|uniref:acetylcholine receptor subunit alpha-like 2 n=1 Tax=Bradysia coprophila TaxID=38358 RepID=UPI00187DA0AF|nr:acetylcholine receptor subunit alpha-like 2 [Bradysia coprophila]